MINIVFAGDEISGVVDLFDAFQAALSAYTREAVGGGAKIQALLHTAPPTTLQSAVDLVVLTYSPVHPGTFGRLAQEYVPAYAHMASARFALVACRLELTVNETVRKKMESMQLLPIFVDEAEQQFIALGPQAAVIEEGLPLLLAASAAVRASSCFPFEKGAEQCAASPSFLFATNALLAWCVEQVPNAPKIAAESFLSISRWVPFRVAVEDVQAGATRMYGERAALLEWIEVELSHGPKLVRPYYVSRATGAVAVTKPPAALAEEVQNVTTGALDSDDVWSQFAVLFSSVRSGTATMTQPFMLRKAVASAEKSRSIAALRHARQQRHHHLPLPLHPRDDSTTLRTLQYEVDQLQTRKSALLELRQYHDAVRADAILFAQEQESQQKWLEQQQEELAALDTEIAKERTRLQDREATVAEYAILAKEVELMPSANAATTKQYLAEWNVSKGLRAERDGIEKKIQSLMNDALSVRRQQLEPLERRLDMLRERAEEQFSLFLDAQNRQLQLAKESWLDSSSHHHHQHNNSTSSTAAHVYRLELGDALSHVKQAALELSDVLERCTELAQSNDGDSNAYPWRNGIEAREALERSWVESEAALVLLTDVVVPFDIELLHMTRKMTTVALMKLSTLSF